MKKLVQTLSWVVFLVAGLFSNANAASPENFGNCNWDFWFKNPNCGSSYEAGKDIYVRIDAQKYQDIEYMELYVNNQFIRKETSYPFEWCVGSGNSDSKLRHMQPGNYKLKVKVKDKCGDYHEKYCDFVIKGHGNGGGHGGHCEWESWFKNPNCGGSYNSGSDVYVKIDPKKYQDIEYIELYVNNQFVRKETSYPYEWCVGSGNSDSYLRHMQPGNYKLKARIKDKCGEYHEIFCDFYVKGHDNGGGHNQCDWKGWFKDPNCNGSYPQHKDVYVRYEIDKYQQIEWVELYVNNKLVRKETGYPYEWCKGSGNSDSYLRHLNKGTYNLKVKIKDKCGNYREEYCKFYIN